MAWKRAPEVFVGEMEALRALIGRRVRSLTTGSYPGFDGVALAHTDPVALDAGTEGFIANRWENSVLVALSTQDERFDTLDKLMRSGGFHLVAVDRADFDRHFEIDDELQPEAPANR